MSEIDTWRLVQSHPDYEVSDAGGVRSWKTGQARMMRLAPMSTGYLGVTLCLKGARSTKAVHRLVLEAFAGPCPTGMEALHGNGVYSDCRLSNLKWGTHEENMRDQRRHGTAPTGSRNGASTKPERVLRGEQHGNAVLTDEKAAAIFCESLSHRDSARRHGVSKALVTKIKGGEAWAHVTFGLVPGKLVRTRKRPLRSQRAVETILRDCLKAMVGA